MLKYVAYLGAEKYERAFRIVEGLFQRLDAPDDLIHEAYVAWLVHAMCVADGFVCVAAGPRKEECGR